MYLLIPLGAEFLVFGATAWVLVRGFRSTRSSGYLVLLAGLLGIPVLSFLIRPLIIGYAIEGQAANGPPTPGKLAALLFMTFDLFKGALVLLGLWLVVRNHSDAATQANKRLHRTGAVAPAAEPQPR